jgi:non-ribosomal peptide synthetase component F
MSETLILTTRLKEDRDYWIAQLARHAGPSSLPLDFKRSKVYSPKQDTVALNLSAAVCERLTNLTSDSSFLIYATLMAALKVCLHKYTHETTIVVGSPAYRGDEDELRQLNALAIVDDVDDRLSFKEFLLRTRETLLEAYARQDFPLSNLIKEHPAAEAENKCPLFDIALVFEQTHGPLPEVKNDITITFARDGAGLCGRVDFKARLFHRETVERFAVHYLNLLEHALQNTDARIRDLALIAGEERERLLFDWNDTARDYPAGACLQQLFEAQVERTPDAVAVSFADKSLTYRELNSRSNQLAHYLKELGVGREALVGLCLERSIEMIVGILGTLKRGAAIVPLDRHIPPSASA